MREQTLVYYSAEGITYYLDITDTEVPSVLIQQLMRFCDYCFAKNKYGHWQFIKNRKEGDVKSEYFELKDLLSKIDLHPTYQNSSSLNRCKLIHSPDQVNEIINQWNRERENMNRLLTPWYDQ